MISSSNVHQHTGIHINDDQLSDSQSSGHPYQGKARDNASLRHDPLSSGPLNDRDLLPYGETAAYKSTRTDDTHRKLLEQVRRLSNNIRNIPDSEEKQ